MPLCAACAAQRVSTHSLLRTDGQPQTRRTATSLPNFKKFMTDSFVSVTLGAMPSFTNPNNWKFRSNLYSYCREGEESC